METHLADKSKIEWTDSSWTPIRALDLKTGKIGWHCEHATTGCIGCYSESMNKRLGTGLPFKPGHREHVKIFLDEKMLLAPLRWKKPRMIFVCSMTDAFADFVRDEWLDKMFAVMALCPQHTFQVLTKRAERMRDYMTDPDDGRGHINTIHRVWDAAVALDCKEHLSDEQSKWLDPDKIDPPWPLPNVWLGVSAERQQEADERIPHLLNTPAAVRFVSAEPLLGPIDFTRINTNDPAFGAGAYQLNALSVTWNGLRALDWVIVGGESGHNARPMNPQWARDIRDQCAAAGVAFFHKQNGEFASVSEVEGEGRHHHFDDGRTVRRVGKKAAGRLLDGKEHNGFPTTEVL